MSNVFLFFLFLLNSFLLNAQTASTDLEIINCRRVEIDASFPGGEKEWQNYLIQNFRDQQLRCEIPYRDTPYTQNIVVMYKILKDGSIGEVRCKNSSLINIFLANEVVRLIKESPKWIPAIQNGRLVNVYKTEEFSFTVSPLYL
jgi:hypothetical protein